MTTVTALSVKVSQLQSGVSLMILLDSGSSFIPVITDPKHSKATGLVPGQLGAGLGDTTWTIGCRPFHEGSVAHVFSKAEPGTKWGVLRIGHELVVRAGKFVNSRTFFYTGYRITHIAILEPFLLGAVTIERMSDEVIASLTSDLRCWDSGRNAEEAVGKIALSHTRKFIEAVSLALVAKGLPD